MPKKWSERRDLNPQSSAPKADAIAKLRYARMKMVGIPGFKPGTYRLRGESSIVELYSRNEEGVWSCVRIRLREPTAYVRWQYPLPSVKWRE